MEKQNVSISYSGSGVQTLNGFGTFFFIVAAISIIVALISIMSIIGIMTAGIFITNAISSLAAGAICKGLSTVAKTALYKRMLLEKQYNFVESESSIEESEESNLDGETIKWKCPHIFCGQENITKKEKYMICQSCGGDVEMSNGLVFKRK